VRLAQVDSGTGPVVVEVAGEATRPLAYHADLTTLIRSGVSPHCLPRGGWFPEPLALVAPLRPGKIITVGREGGIELTVVVGRRRQGAACIFGYLVGPIVVTADEIGTEILSFAATHCTLEPGDLIRTSRRSLWDGDIVEVEAIGMRRSSVSRR
jgi:hypothetical protein